MLTEKVRTKLIYSQKSLRRWRKKVKKGENQLEKQVESLKFEEAIMNLTHGDFIEKDAWQLGDPH